MSTDTAVGEPRHAVGPDLTGRRPSWLCRSAVALPDRVLMVFFWTTLVVFASVMIGQFRPWVVLPAVLVVVVLTWRLAPEALPPSRSAVWGSLGAVLIAAVWLVSNLPYASRYLIVLRDPGFLTLAGVWLSDNPSPNMPIGTAEEIAASVPGAESFMDPYYLEDGLLHVQGAKLFPAVIAMPGWFAGIEGVLVANLAIGAVGLITVYGLARRLTGPLWGLVPTVALAASVPMTALSRAAYTEPLAMIAVMGGITLAWSAYQTKAWWRLALAGAMIGSSALSRIDGAASVVGLIVGAGLIAGCAARDHDRRRLWLATLAAVAAATLMVALGWLDLYLNSRDYLGDLSSQYTQLVAVLSVACLGALVLPLRRPWRWLRRWVLNHRRGLAMTCGALTVVVAVALASRPLWLTTHNLEGPYADLVASLQAAEGLQVDGTRSYDEMSVAWLSWYLGWPAVILGFSGIALLTYRAIRRRDARMLIVVAVIAAPTALYLARVSITPDQIWAIRRFLPVTVPGMLVIATWTVQQLVGWARRPRVIAIVRGAQALVAVAIMGFPLTTWSGLASTVEMGGRLEELRTACAAISDGRAVYLRMGGPPYLQTLTTVCDVEAVEFTEETTAAQLAAVREAWGGAPLTLVAFSEDIVPWAAGADPVAALTTEVTTWPSRLSGIPTEPSITTSQLWLGTIQEDGTVVPAD